LLKAILGHFAKRLATVCKTRVATRSDAAKIALHRTHKNGVRRSRPPILYLDRRIVDIDALYRSTDEATTWIPLNGITHPRNTLTTACRDLYTFEFEFKFRGRGSKCGRKTN